MGTVKVEKSYTTLLDEDLIPYVHRGDEKSDGIHFKQVRTYRSQKGERLLLGRQRP